MDSLGWQAYKAPDYDRLMQAKCERLLTSIASNAERCQSILTDPRALHSELFSEFTPPSHPEYAGTYRGAPGTTLRNREIQVKSQLKPEECFSFVRASEVPARMNYLMTVANALPREADDYKNLLGLSYVFCWFGSVHPFLDGNGHVQRAIFAALATKFGYPLTSRFAIHPRPYDILLALALEIFTRAPNDQKDKELPVAAEYLAFFLGGPFEAPRKHLALAKPSD